MSAGRGWGGRGWGGRGWGGRGWGGRGWGGRGWGGRGWGGRGWGGRGWGGRGSASGGWWFVWWVVWGSRSCGVGVQWCGVLPRWPSGALALNAHRRQRVRRRRRYATGRPPIRPIGWFSREQHATAAPVGQDHLQ
ncbi:hypothetical protein EG812_02205 [Verrucosispora sp. FIM060022]|nr:hypothetical protein EG812_02205 [Verrucosispora sp. FIM060022]